jgi:hypothetical protein
MTARTKSKITPKYKTKYKVKNWPAYEAALKKRGDITVWFDEGAIRAWNAPPSGRPGGQTKYSDVAIVTSLTLRLVFHLALRQTEGFVASLIRLMGLGLDAPDHTTLSRRNSNVEVPRLAKTHDGPIHLVVDSTGLKIIGDGEWHAHKHKTSNKRRTWRKLHLGLDDDGVIVASDLTDSSVADASVGVTMIEEIGAVIERFTADGAYDTKAIYETLAAATATEPIIVVPPKRTAAVVPRVTGPLGQRNDAIERIAEVGRRQWRKESGAHQQARAENGMYRYKRLIGVGLRARTFDAQWREAMIGVNVLNRMTELGTPKSDAIAA